MEAATVARWKPAKGTGVLRTDEGRDVWFHVTDLDGLRYADIHKGLRVDVVIDETPQDSFSCRAEHVRPFSQHLPR
ncbi:hypothetical protein [Nocardia camponoti]|uniref:Cold shock domain-containing protein n=1 Tax=Nocardia camponoti TaxID=1616106 RepID=A0A917QSC3_9NOCA|nr:hypothetical protein [Nocardia camponoti]GGK64850.1 hypothetical protein GCM10011591_41380 [Nocardia camponoti]